MKLQAPRTQGLLLTPLEPAALRGRHSWIMLIPERTSGDNAVCSLRDRRATACQPREGFVGCHQRPALSGSQEGATFPAFSTW